jgi:hypothetical protein
MEESLKLKPCYVCKCKLSDITKQFTNDCVCEVEYNREHIDLLRAANQLPANPANLTKVQSDISNKTGLSFRSSNKYVDLQ